jgi:hypothetical protein
VLDSVRLAFVWMNQLEINLRETSRLVKEGCNGMERQNMVIKMSKIVY